jgi:nucleoside-diphosphate-sugar epimerase
MKVLVTGSEGYIGTILVQELLKKSFDVVGLDTNFYADGHLYPVSGIEYELINKDVRNVTVEDLKGFEAVVHLAELSNDPLGQNDPELTFEINQGGTKILAEAAKQAGVKRFVYFSSCSIYGASENISDESTKPNPLTAYAISKVKNEEMLMKMNEESFTITIFRNATVFGASPRMRFDLVVNDLCALAHTEKIIRMTSDGSPWRPLVHVLDVCEAVRLTLNAPRSTIGGQLFNVGSNDNNYQVRQLAEIIAEVFPGCTTEFGDSTGDKRNYRVNFDRIQKVLPEFKTQCNVKKGAEELQKIFAEIHLTTELHKSRLYTRLKQLEYLKSEHKVDNKLFWSK